MTEITIGLSDDARRELAARAARSGRSLEDYLADELEHLARKPAPDDDWIAQVREHAEAGGAALRIEDLLADKEADRR
jgi:antitoxin FitA